MYFCLAKVKDSPLMFTGIIETMGTITRIEREGGNVHYSLSSNITHELKVDQSLAHNGVCLTVVAIDGDQYTCLLYTSPSPRDGSISRMPSSA